MWRRRGKHLPADQAVTSVIDHGCELEGHLNFAGTLVLNGKFQGEINSGGTLLIGEKGELHANACVGVIIVGGTVNGNITARERVELRSSARIFGDIVTPVLVLEEGVVFDGHCRMKGEGLRVIEQFPLKQQRHG